MNYRQRLAVAQNPGTPAETLSLLEKDKDWLVRREVAQNPSTLVGITHDYLIALAGRLRNVRVCCGDWSRIIGPAVYSVGTPCGIFLDPPYSDSNRSVVYSMDCFNAAHDVRKWAIEHGNDSRLRIALCGYDGDILAVMLDEPLDPSKECMAIIGPKRNWEKVK